MFQEFDDLYFNQKQRMYKMVKKDNFYKLAIALKNDERLKNLVVQS